MRTEKGTVAVLAFTAKHMALLGRQARVFIQTIVQSYNLALGRFRGLPLRSWRFPLRNGQKEIRKGWQIAWLLIWEPTTKWFLWTVRRKGAVSDGGRFSGRQNSEAEVRVCKTWPGDSKSLHIAWEIEASKRAFCSVTEWKCIGFVFIFGKWKQS